MQRDLGIFLNGTRGWLETSGPLRDVPAAPAVLALVLLELLCARVVCQGSEPRACP